MAAELVFRSKRAEKFFRDLDRNVDEITDVHKKYVTSISAVVFADIMNHFQKEQGPDRKWSPWSKIYRERMIKKGKGNNKILQDSGRLRQSFLPTNWRTSSQGIHWFNNAVTRKGFPYALHHNEGPSDGKKPRPFMWLSGKALTRISAITAAYTLRK